MYSLLVVLKSSQVKITMKEEQRKITNNNKLSKDNCSIYIVVLCLKSFDCFIVTKNIISFICINLITLLQLMIVLL